MSGHVVFTEGRNDVYFVQKVLERCNESPDVTKYVAEDEHRQTISVGEQERALRDFRRDDHDHFLKSEGGDGGLYDVFAYSAEKIVTGQFDATLVLDLDERGFEPVVGEVRESLTEEFDGSMEWDDGEQVATEGDLWVGEATLADVNTGDSSTFALVTFEDDLEAAVGCASTDDRSERFRAIREYAHRRPVIEAFLELYD
ncbi:hypothetical protein RYH80_00980 [Halobaculum sp. MBLA0147]|uniref:hypothetical protein n=1 Tax=Halobaculum sp. MBLA0147 TaxID=3079934 RepID=UPI0035253A95